MARPRPTGWGAGAATAPSAAAGPGAALPVSPEGRLDPDPVLHLLRRTTYGPTPALVAEVRDRGVQAWLDDQLAPAGIDDSACDAVVGRFPLYAMDPAELRTRLPQGDWAAMFETVRVALARRLWSRRQLLEIMVELWWDRLHVTVPSSEVWDSAPAYDRAVIRPHALGRYADLLLASAKSTAMLRYLDNASSRSASPNENYGRELLELHTVGVGAGFTEADVKASALVLTGWTLDAGTQSFAYRAGWHRTGSLSVLGWSAANDDPAGGFAVGEDYLRWLARHPATATQVAIRLARRFVADDPPAGLVARLAATYLAADTAIVPVLRVLLTSPELAGSVGAKVRRPGESLLATARALAVGPGPDTRGVEALHWAVAELGDAPLGWPAPNGYPDVAAAWDSPAATLGRWNTNLGLVQGWWKGLAYTDRVALLATPRPASCGALVDAVALRLVGQRLPAAPRDALLTFIGHQETDPVDDGTLRWQLDPLAALVLSSPLAALR